MTDSQLANIFCYHRPQPGQAERYQRIRDEALKLATLINLECPESREKATALTNLQQTVMWANASIAIHEKPVGVVPIPPMAGVLPLPG